MVALSQPCPRKVRNERSGRDFDKLALDEVFVENDTFPCLGRVGRSDTLRRYSPHT
jgi:hypothetical protein